MLKVPRIQHPISPEAQELGEKWQLF